MGKITILDETTKNPITLAGLMSGVAYGSDITSDAKNYKRGLECITSNHGRVLEFPQVFMELEDYSIKAVREMMRHVGDGLSVVQESTRYVKFTEKNFSYVTPPKIAANEDALKLYQDTMTTIGENYLALIDEYKIPKEDASALLPLNLTTRLSMRKNARDLQNMYAVRSCSRAYHEMRDMMDDLDAALRSYSEEWNTLCDIIFKTKCEAAGYCTEAFGCGRYPKQEEL